MAVALTAVVLAARGSVSWTTVFVLLVGLELVRRLAHGISESRDSQWLPNLLPLAFAAKMIGGLANYYFAVSAGDGGDAATYYRVAVDIAPSLRQLRWPDLQIGSLGTRTVGHVSGVFYALTGMDLLGGFLLFSLISFVGLVLFYAAYRRATTGHSLKMYFFGIFFLPTMVFWPSAIGKDALISFCLGLTAYGAARLLSSQVKSGLALSAIGIAMAYPIRPHIAVLALGSIVLGSLVALHKGWSRTESEGYRIPVLVLAGAAMLVVMPMAMQQIGADEGLITFVEEIQRRSAIGDSAIESTPILSPARAPIGVISVVSRPFPHEADNLPQMVAAIEGVLLLIMGARALPRMVRERSRFLEQPYFAFALAFSGGFIIAFSAADNLGILARQRAQVLPFLLAVIVLFTPLARRRRLGPTRDSGTSREASRRESHHQQPSATEGA